MLLVALDLNGSSIGVLSRGGDPWIPGSMEQAQNFGPDPALIAGTPRPIRSDEWAQWTPVAIAQARSGFQPQIWLGLTDTKLSAITFFSPAAGYAQIFRPQGWGYLLLGDSHGLAWQWWFAYLVAALGIYYLLYTLIGSVPIATGLALAGAFTPYAGWWSGNPVLIMGFLALGTTCVMRGFASRSRVHGAIWGVAAGVLGAAAILPLYPPWTISSAWICLALMAGFLLDRRPPIHWIALTLGPAALALTAALVPWYLANRDAIAAVADTIYPGPRVSSSGEARLSFLLDAPANPLIARAADLGLNNPTETAGGLAAAAVTRDRRRSLLLAPPALIELSRRELAGGRHHWTIIAVAIAMSVRLARAGILGSRVHRHRHRAEPGHRRSAAHGADLGHPRVAGSAEPTARIRAHANRPAGRRTGGGGRRCAHVAVGRPTNPDVRELAVGVLPRGRGRC